MRVKKPEIEIVTVTDVELSTDENLDLTSSRQISFYHAGAENPFYTETHTIRYAALLVIMTRIC
jgi:hypothetical protein